MNSSPLTLKSYVVPGVSCLCFGEPALSRAVSLLDSTTVLCLCIIANAGQGSLTCRLGSWDSQDVSRIDSNTDREKSQNALCRSGLQGKCLVFQSSVWRRRGPQSVVSFVCHFLQLGASLVTCRHVGLREILYLASHHSVLTFWRDLPVCAYWTRALKAVIYQDNLCLCSEVNTTCAMQKLVIFSHKRSFCTGSWTEAHLLVAQQYTLCSESIASCGHLFHWKLVLV